MIQNVNINEINVFPLTIESSYLDVYYGYGALSKSQVLFFRDLIEDNSDKNLETEDFYNNIIDYIEIIKSKFWKDSKKIYIDVILPNDSYLSQDLINVLSTCGIACHVLIIDSSCSCSSYSSMLHGLNIIKGNNVEFNVISSLLVHNNIKLDNCYSFCSRVDEHFDTLGFSNVSNEFGLLSVSDIFCLSMSDKLLNDNNDNSKKVIILDYFTLIPPQKKSLDLTFKLSNCELNNTYYFSDRCLSQCKKYFDFVYNRGLIVADYDAFKNNDLIIKADGLKSFYELNFSDDNRKLSFCLRNIYIGMKND